jgi:protein-tyrosine-phosphatase
MAEAISNSLVSNTKGNSSTLKVEFSSAGIYAVKGQSASLNAAKAMEDMGLNLSHHIATPISEELLEVSDLILTLTESHKHLIISRFPNYKDKTHTLLEYIGECGDIEDPFGGDIGVYRNCAQQIKGSIEKLLLIIKES